jgi:hypothetical protein
MLDILFNLFIINTNIRVGFKHNYIMKVQVNKIGAQVSVTAGFFSITLKLDEVESTYSDLLQFAHAIIPQTWKDDMGWNDDSQIEKHLGRYVKYVPEAIALIKGFDCNYEITFKEDGTLHYNVKDFTGGIIDVKGMYLLADKVRMDEEAIREERRAEQEARDKAWEAEMKAAEDAAKEAVESLDNCPCEATNTFKWDENNRSLTFDSTPTISQLYFALQTNGIITADEFLDQQASYVSHEWNSIATAGRIAGEQDNHSLTILISEAINN